MSSLSPNNILTTLGKIINEFEKVSVQEKDNFRDRGVTYTPQPIAQFMVLNIFRIYFDDAPEINKFLKRGVTTAPSVTIIIQMLFELDLQD